MNVQISKEQKELIIKYAHFCLDDLDKGIKLNESGHKDELERIRKILGMNHLKILSLFQEVIK